MATLKSLRERVGQSQDGLAEALGVSRSYVALIEQGRRDMPDALAAKWARALKSDGRTVLDVARKNAEQRDAVLSALKAVSEVTGDAALAEDPDARAHAAAAVKRAATWFEAVGDDRTASQLDGAVVKMIGDDADVLAVTKSLLGGDEPATKDATSRAVPAATPRPFGDTSDVLPEGVLEEREDGVYVIDSTTGQVVARLTGDVTRHQGTAAARKSHPDRDAHGRKRERDDEPRRDNLGRRRDR